MRPLEPGSKSESIPLDSSVTMLLCYIINHVYSYRLLFKATLGLHNNCPGLVFCCFFWVTQLFKLKGPTITGVAIQTENCKNLRFIALTNSLLVLLNIN